MRSYLSIRWKILFLTGMVMAGMAGLFSLQQQFALTQQFSADQARYRERLEAMTGRLFQSQNDHLQVLARMLAETPAIRAAMQANSRTGLREAVEPLWPELSLGQGLAALVFFDAEQQVLGHWGDPVLARLAAMAKVAGARELPQTWVGCVANCMHQIVLPVAGQGQTLGAVALVVGLENIILDLRRLGEGEVAVLAGARGSPSSPLAGLRLLSVSGGEAARSVLQAAQSRSWDGASIRVSAGETTWHVMPFAPDISGDGLLHFAMISDVTQAMEAIQSATRRNLAWGAGVLLGAGAAIHFLLWPAMGRIQRVSRLLPLLGQERFDEVIQAIPLQADYRLADEMHALERLARDLALQLKSLHEADELQAAALSAQAAQLEQERDLVSGLLDTAPVLIVTYGQDRCIRMVNAYAVLDSGMNREQLVGKLFSTLFMNESQQIEHKRQLQGMHPGDVMHGEGSFIHPTGNRRDAVWFHSCLDDAQGERLYLSVGLDVTEHRLAEQRLQLLVEHDAVTGLLNRRTFKRELDDLLAKGGQGMLLVCDLDEFRSLNDVEGHETGDRVLMLFAQHIQHMEPAPVIAARLGSDEFALVFNNLNAADAILLARHLNRVVSHQTVGPDSGALKRHLSASVGLASFPEHGETADELVGNAELALTNARAKGYGSWHLYSEQEAYRELAGRRAYWRDEVEVALDEGRFTLHFQPIVHIASGELSHYEALLRLIGRDGKLIPPGLFIDVAESTGLIRRIDRWVLEAAVAAAGAQDQTRIALNLSSRSFDDDMAFETMQTALARHQVSGDRLKIEITETAALANFSGAKRIMARFKALGCAFGLDDFGVGYSSFQYLKELPVDFVKIDGSFIKNLTKNPDDVVFVRALHGAVRGFGKTTVAEFVEDEETLAILRDIGVDHAQGYLLGKPAPNLDWRPG